MCRKSLDHMTFDHMAQCYSRLNLTTIYDEIILHGIAIADAFDNT